MPGFEPATGLSLIDNESIGFETRSFLRGADHGSLTSTLYSIPSDRSLITSGRVILNYGNLEPEKADKRLEYARELQSRGVDVRLYGESATERRIHIKSYTGSFGGREEALISTANLSEMEASAQSRQERIKQYTGRVTQHNLAIRIRDRDVVRQVAQAQSVASRGEVPRSSRNVLVGGSATSAAVRRISRAREGDRVVLSSPYLDDQRVIAALITAREQGANVTVISSNPQTRYSYATGGNSAKVTEALGMLEQEGVRVLTPSKDDPFFFHTKALAIASSSDERSTFFLGSHNFTTAAKQDRSVDMMLALNDRAMAGALADQLLTDASAYELTEYQTPGKVPRMTGVERHMHLRGMGDLYRVAGKTTHVLDKRTNLTPDFAGRGTMPYYPTKMDSEFFDYFIGSELPAVTIYSDLWKARTGQAEIPTAIKRLDSEMSDPGLGNMFNRIVGTKVYEEGYGVVGSALLSAGRFIDWALGFEHYQEAEKQRAGAYAGSVRKMFGLQGEEQQQAGPFETILGKGYQMVASTAATLAFYVAVDLPLKYVKAAFEQDYISYLVELPDQAKPTVMGKVAKATQPVMRAITFGATFGGAITDLVNDPSVTRQSYSHELYERLYNPANVKRDPNRFARTRDGRITQIDLGDEPSLLSLNTMMRRFDAERFGNLTKPILELINPYDYGSIRHGEYMASLNKLQEVVGQRPTLEFVEAADDPNVYEPIFRHIGVERITTIAKHYDDIAALMPANLAYWVPPLRRMLNLEPFDPTQHITIRDLVSFENAVKWTHHFYKQATTVLKNPYESVRKVASAWKGELELIRTERQLVSAINSVKVGKPSLRQGVMEALEDLHNFEASVYQQRIGDLNNLLNDQRYVAYRDKLAKQQALLDQSPFRVINETYPSSPNPFKADDSEAGRRLAGLRNNLLGVGIFLLADQMADKFIFQPLGASLLTQAQAHDELNTEDGQVARYKFTGVVPREGILAIQAIAGLGAGFLLPRVIDLTNRPGVPSSSFGEIRELDRRVDQMSKEIKAQVPRNRPILRTREVEAAETAAAMSKAKYTAMRQGLVAAGARRVGLRFNTTAALTAAFLASLGTKALFMGAAAIMNFIHHRNEPGISVGSTDAMLSASLEQLTVDAMHRAEGRGDYANIALGHTLAQNLLQQGDNKTRIYSIASQLTTPFFQIPLVVKADPSKGRATLSIGLQLMPSTGLGLTPALPFAIQLRQPQANAEETFMNYFKDSLSPGDYVGLAFRALLSSVTFGSGLVYEKESSFEQGLEFIGLSTALGLAGRRVADANIRGGLIKTFGENSVLVRNFDDLAEQTKTIRQIAGGSLEFANKSMRFMYSLTPALMSSTAKGAMAAIAGQDVSSLKMPKALRRAAPYYLALTMARLMSDPNGGYVGEDFNNPLTQLSATLVAGGAIGYVLDKTGVFASAEELADEFHQVMGRGSRTTAAYKAAMGEWLPAVGKDETLIKEVDELVEDLSKTEIKSKSPSRWNFSKRLLSTMAAPALWEQAVEARDRRLTEIDNKLGRRISSSELPGGRIKSLGARIAVAALAVGLVKGTAFTIANMLPSQVLEGVYKTPVLGAGFRLLAGVEPQDDKLHQQQFDGVRGAEGPRGAAALISKVSKTLSFGMFDLAKATGLYSDTTDPFLSLFGPFGLTFKPERIGSYVQFASQFSDISASAYDMTRRGVSSKLSSQALALLKSGKPDSLEVFIAKLRGGRARQNRAKHVGTTGYEMQALSSSGISRAVRLRRFYSDWQASQTAQEHFLDFMREGYQFGFLGDDTIPGYRQQSNYNPFAFLSNATFALQNFALQTPQLEKFDPQYQIMNWYEQTERRSRSVTQSFSALLFNRELQQLPNAGWVTGPLSMLMLASTAYVGAELVGKIAAQQGQRELKQLIESSPLNQGKDLINPMRYRFVAGELPGTGQSTIFQVDTYNRTQGVYRLALSAEEISPKAPTFEVIASLSKRYYQTHKRLGGFFRGAYAKELRTLMHNSLAAGTLDPAQRGMFVNKNMGRMKGLLRQSLSARIADSHVNLFQVLIGAEGPNLDDAMTKFINESDQFLREAFGEVLDDLDKMVSKGIRPEDVSKGILKLNATLTNSESFQRFYQRLQEPSAGHFDIQGERQAYNRAMRRNFERATGQSVEQYVEGSVQKSKTKTPPIPSASVQELGRPWSQGAMTTTMKGLRGTGRLVADWAATGKSVYELVESGGILLGGQTQSKYMRRMAGEQFIKSGLNWGVSALVAAGVAAMGFGTLPVLAVLIGGALALDWLKEKIRPLRAAENLLVKSLGGLLATPVESTARVFDHIGLGRPVRAVGNLIATPASFLLGVLTAPIRFLTENIAAPILQDQYFGMTTDSLPVQVIKGFLLPQSVYANFQYQEGRTTAAGREPWVYGNPKFYLKQKQLENISRALEVDTYIGPQAAHGYLLGRPTGATERLLTERYFSTYTGGRIFQPFALGGYRLSNSLRRSLEMRQALSNVTVLTAAIARPPRPIDNRALALIQGTSATLSLLQLSSEGNVLDDLKAELSAIWSKAKRLVSTVKEFSVEALDRIKDALPEPIKNLSKKYLELKRKGERSLRVLRVMGKRKFINPALRQLNKIGVFKSLSSAYQTIGTKLSGFTGSLIGYFDKRFEKLIERFDEGLWEGLEETGRLIYDSSLKAYRLLKRAAKFAYGKVVKPLVGYGIKKPISFLRQTNQAQNFFTSAKERLSWLKSKGKQLYKKTADFISESSFFSKFQGVPGSISGSVDRISSYLYNAAGQFKSYIGLGKNTASQLSERARGLLNSVKLNLRRLPLYGLGAVGVLSTVQTQQRIGALNRTSTFREFQQSYREGAIGLMGSIIGGVVGVATRNPLLAIGAAVVGGLLAGTPLGDWLARYSYRQTNEGGSGYTPLESMSAYARLSRSYRAELSALKSGGRFVMRRGGASIAKMNRAINKGVRAVGTSFFSGVAGVVNNLQEFGRSIPSLVLQSLGPEGTERIISLAHELRAQADSFSEGYTEVAERITNFLSRFSKPKRLPGSAPPKVTLRQRLAEFWTKLRQPKTKPLLLTGDAPSQGFGRKILSYAQWLSRSAVESAREFTDFASTGLKIFGSVIGVKLLRALGPKGIERLSKFSYGVGFVSGSISSGLASISQRISSKVEAVSDNISTAVQSTLDALRTKFRKPKQLPGQAPPKVGLRDRIKDFISNLRKPKSPLLTGDAPPQSFGRTVLSYTQWLGRSAFQYAREAAAAFRESSFTKLKTLGYYAGAKVLEALGEEGIEKVSKAVYRAGFVVGSIASWMASTRQWIGTTVAAASDNIYSAVRAGVESVSARFRKKKALPGSVPTKTKKTFFDSTSEWLDDAKSKIAEKTEDLLKFSGDLFTSLKEKASAGGQKLIDFLERRGIPVEKNLTKVLDAANYTGNFLSRFDPSRGLEILRTGAKNLLIKGGRKVKSFGRFIRNRTLALGLQDTILDALGPALDIWSMGSGALKALKFDDQTSFAEVQQAYINMGSGRGSLVGSVFGLPFGPLGDAATSIIGGFVGANQSAEEAKLRYLAKDYGLAPILEDTAQPLIRELVIAGAAGKLAHQGATTVGKAIQRSGVLTKITQRFGVLRSVRRLMQSIAVGFKRGASARTAQGAARFKKVLGVSVGARTVQLASKAPGLIRFAGRSAMRFLDPLISTIRLGSAFQRSGTAQTKEEYDVAIGRSTSALGSMGGYIIGSALGGVIGGAVGSVLGESLFGGMGRDLSRRAYETGTSARRVVSGQMIGAGVGAVLGAIGAGVAVAVGVLAGVALAPAIAVGAGVGLLIGAVAGGYMALKRKVGGSNSEVNNTINRNRRELERTEPIRPITNSPLDSEELKPLERKLIRANEQDEAPWWKRGYDAVGNGFKSVGRMLRAFGTSVRSMAGSIARFLADAGRKAGNAVQEAVLGAPAEAATGPVGPLTGFTGRTGAINTSVGGGLDSRITWNALGGLHRNVAAVLMGIRSIENAGRYANNYTSHAHTGFRRDIGPYQEGYFAQNFQIGLRVLGLNANNLNQWQRYDVAAIGRLHAAGVLDDIQNANLNDPNDRLRIGRGVAGAWRSRFWRDPDYHRKYAEMIRQGAIASEVEASGGSPVAASGPTALAGSAGAVGVPGATGGRGRGTAAGLQGSIAETQVYRGNYRSVTSRNTGRIIITGGFMEAHGHARKAPTQAIFADGRLRNLPASNRNLGIDYVTPDSRIRAWYGGTVTSVRWEGGYGNRLRVATDVTYLYQGREYQVMQAYAHAANFNGRGSGSMRAGARIAGGQDIGQMGATGGNYGAHVDLRTWIVVNGRVVDLSLNALESQLAGRGGSVNSMNTGATTATIDSPDASTVSTVAPARARPTGPTSLGRRQRNAAPRRPNRNQVSTSRDTRTDSQVMASQVPIINNNEQVRQQAITTPSVPAQVVATAYIRSNVEEARAQIAAAQRPPQAIQINTNNPRSDATIAMMNTDSSRGSSPTRTTQVSVNRSTAGTVQVEVVSPDFYQRDIESTTGMGRNSEYGLAGAVA